jgi:hypothetical protein
MVVVPSAVISDLYFIVFDGQSFHQTFAVICGCPGAVITWSNWTSLRLLPTP